MESQVTILTFHVFLSIVCMEIKSPKDAIIDALRRGVEIFDWKLPAYLHMDLLK